MAPSRVRRRGTFGAFRRPFLTDPVFWIAAALSLALGALVGGVLFGLGGVPDSAVMWIFTVVLTLVAAWLSFKLLAMGLNLGRALESEEVADERRAENLEGKGRAAGALLGKGAARLAKGRSNPSTSPRSAPSGQAAPSSEPSPAARPPEPSSTPAGAAPHTGAADVAAAHDAGPAPEVTVDKAARVLGSMVGRRLGDRRKDGS